MKPSLLSKAVVGIVCAMVLTLIAGAPIAQATGLIDLTQSSSRPLAASKAGGHEGRIPYDGAGTVADPTATPTQSAGSVVGPTVGTGDGSSRGGAVVGVSLTLVGLAVLAGVFTLSRASRSSS